MISPRASQAFEQMLSNALRPVMGGGVLCTMEPLSLAQPRPGTKLVAITLSSYLFRMMVLINFGNDTATKQHMAQWSKTLAADMSERQFLDAISEMANRGCGALSRSLSAVFPHIGMSTPNVLDWRCAEYLDALRCGHRKQFAVAMDSTVMFHVDLCICEYADMDFTMNAVVEEESTGELEMF
jgi:hypothetical protein